MLPTIYPLCRRLVLVGIATMLSVTCLGLTPAPHTGDEANGEHVLAIWQFVPGDQELADGKGAAELALTGRARIVPDEVFGGALECFATLPGEDKPNGARSAWRVAPTPAGAFTLEAWVKLKEEPGNPDWTTAYIIDKTYVPRTHENKDLNKDYYFSLRQRAKGKSIVLQAGVGLGEEVITYSSDPVDYQPGVWRHMAFSYDGNGTGMLFVDGRMVGRQVHEGKGPAAPGSRNLSLGERTGSMHSGLPGYLAQVRILQGISNMVALLDVAVEHPFQRTAFERMEPDQVARVTLTNLDGRTMNGVVLNLDDGLSTRRIDVGNLGEEPLAVSVPLDCSGKAGEVVLRVAASGQMAGNRVTGSGTFSYTLCNRLPEFMPVVMWGGASFERMKAIGFTHSLHWMDHVDMQAWNAGEPLEFVPRFDELRQTLNQAMIEGVRVMGKMSPGSYFKSQKAYEEARQPYLCHDREGRPTKMVNFSLPRIQQHGFNVGRSVANNVGMFPVVDMVLADSEFRDGGQLSFREEDRAAFRAYSGFDIPDSIKSKSGVKYERIEGFPHDRIIPDDHPILTYYRWLWGGGDGYPGFLSQDRRGLVTEGSRIRMLWDPVVRCPSKWGSGGDSDLIGHWTYVYPDPLVMGLAADEVVAMCKGGPDYQQPTKMTQVIWYRSNTTGPMPEDETKRAEWERRLPDARFITIPPDMLEIALWQKLARPVRAIMYHGAGSLWDKGRPGGYDFTNPDTAPRLASLIAGVVRPFGPMLLQVPDRPSRVAMLESFASQMFYGGTTSGTMRGAVGRMHGVLVRAHLQPEIIYDETILRDGLDQFEVLVLPVCPVLTERVAARIKDWQARGGILVADGLLAPGLSPDIMIRQVESDSKDESVAKARELRQELGEVYLPYAEADTADAVLRVRTAGQTDYLFALNDKRTYGDYVGQYRKVMEKGLPLQAQVMIRREGGVVYDLLAGKQVETQAADGALRFAAAFGPGEGRLYMITERPIAAVTVASPAEAQRASRVTLSIAVTDAAGQPIDAVVPLRVDIFDAQENLAEFSGWHAAPDGRLTLDLDVAANDAVGAWTVRVRDLASGTMAAQQFVVR